MCQAQEVCWDSILDSMNIWRFGSFDIFHFNLRCQLEKRNFPKHPWVAIINYTENQYKFYKILQIVSLLPPNIENSQLYISAPALPPGQWPCQAAAWGRGGTPAQRPPRLQPSQQLFSPQVALCCSLQTWWGWYSELKVAQICNEFDILRYGQ